MMTISETRQRIEQELTELERLTAEAPSDHPARVALTTIRQGIADGRATDSWYRWVGNTITVRTLANDVAKGIDIFKSMLA